MKNIRILLRCIIITVILFTVSMLMGCSSEQKNTENIKYQVTDAKGTIVNFDKKPEKILTLSLSTDNIVLGLVTTDKLVAINNLADDKTCSNIVHLAEKVPVKIKNPTAEEIFALHPDLVIVPDWGRMETVDNLRELGIKVVVVKGAKTYNDIQDTIKIIAEALGEKEKGLELIALMDNELLKIKNKVKEIPENERKNIVLISVMTAYGGSGCTYDEACKYAGVINGISAAGLKNGQTLTKEMLVKINPDVLLMPVYNDHGKFDTSGFIDSYLKDPSLQTIKAIKNNNIVFPRDGYIYNASQDFVFGIKEILRAAYGRKYDFPDNMHLTVSGEDNN